MSQSQARRARRTLARSAPKATREQVQQIVRQIKAAVARQVALAGEQHDKAAANDALFEAARDLRRQAIEQERAGNVLLRDTLVEQAQLLESAAQPLELN